MSSLWRIVDRIPSEWRYLLATGLPLSLGIGAHFVVGWFGVVLGAAASLMCVFVVASRQRQHSTRTALGIIRSRAIQRGYKLPTTGPTESVRIAHAINRFTAEVEQTLADAEIHRRYHETILNELSAGVLVVDALGILQYANRAAGEILGFDVDGIRDGTTQLGSKVNVYELNDAAMTCATSNEVASREVEVYGSGRHLEIVARPLPPEQLGIGRAAVIVNDRTEEIRLGVSMREFVANASHELRTPISVIQASVESLKMGAIDDSEATKRFLDRIDGGSQRLAGLVSEMMDLTLLETGRMSTHLESVMPSDLIQSVVDSYGPLAESAELRITSHAPENLEPILADRHKLERAIGNLVTNAVKFTHAGGSIEISCCPSDSVVEISVSDSGIGIAAEELPHVFERFYKSSRATADRSGYGLGLAITKHIVELHGGEIEVESVLGEGTTFKIRLPRG